MMNIYGKSIILFFCLMGFGSMAMASCLIEPPTFNFGNYQAMGMSPIELAIPVHVQCTKPGESWTLEAVGGNSNSCGARYMTNSRNSDSRLYYNLFVDGGYTTPLGGDGCGATLHGIAGTRQQSIIYVRMPAGQTRETAGSYQDSLQFRVR